ncbi:MAG: hypothetical protein GY769_22075, partial [bacterium]|nr:hypothetical protein [bacterium]
VVHHKSREPEKVIPLLRKALELLDPARDPRRQTIVRHNLMAALLEADRPHEAKRYLEALRRMHREQGGQLNTLRFHWLEGRLAYATGDLDKARSLFTEVRNSFIEWEIGIDVALIPLDLAQVLFDENELTETQRRLNEAIAILKSLGVHAEARAALAFLEDAIRVQEAGTALIRQTAAFIRKAENDPSIRFRPSEVTAPSGAPA